MNITYIFRAPGKERSIERVFEPIMQSISAAGHQVKVSFAKSSKFWPLAMLYNMVIYSITSYRDCDRIYHITGDVQYIACLMNPKNTILTIHDCVTLHNEQAQWWLRKLVYWLWYYIPLKRLNSITCISETTRQDLLSFFPWAEKKLVVIANPVGIDFVPYIKEFNANKPVILHVGTRTNKNLERVIEALDGIICTLDVIGQLTEDQERLLKLHKVAYKNRFGISNQDVLQAYINADIISFPSIFEGFGMPIIEGQAIGRPVLTSDREPMKSVAGRGACLVNPESVDSIHQGFIQLIEDSEYRNRVNKAGIENSKKYSIDSITELYCSLYNELSRTTDRIHI